MKNILDKINKAYEVEATKLAKHEVNLGLVEDIASATAKAREISKNLIDALESADKYKIELDKSISTIKKLYPQASKHQDAEDKIWEKAAKAATDLGLKKEDIKGWKEFADSGLAVNSAINGANKYMS